MSGRYIPPAARRTEPAENGEPSAGITQAADIDQLPGRSLEELSLSQPSDPNSQSRGRGNYRGQNRGYNRGNQRGWHQNRGQGRGRGGNGSGSNSRGRWSTLGNQHNNQDRRNLHLRPPHDDEFFLHEIEAHFWPETGAVRTSEKSTLNDSFEHKDQLAYVVLFKDANPRWEDDGIIFAKTSIDLLPGYETAFKHPGQVEMDEESVQAFAKEEEAMNALKADQAPGKTETGADAESLADMASLIIEQPALTADSASGNTETGAASDTVNKDDSATDGPKSIIIEDQSVTDGPLSANPPARQDTADGPPSSTPPARIAIFSQTLPGRNKSSIFFSFQGWYSVGKVEFLHPRSKALAKMMAQKWDLKDSFGRSRTVKRDRAGWLKSMNQRWAVVQFVKMLEQEPMPEIQRLKRFSESDKEVESGFGVAGDGEKDVQNEIQQSESIKTLGELGDVSTPTTDTSISKEEDNGHEEADNHHSRKEV